MEDAKKQAEIDGKEKEMNDLTNMIPTLGESSQEISEIDKKNEEKNSNIEEKMEVNLTIIKTGKQLRQAEGPCTSNALHEERSVTVAENHNMEMPSTSKQLPLKELEPLTPTEAKSEAAVLLKMEEMCQRTKNLLVKCSEQRTLLQKQKLAVTQSAEERDKNDALALIKMKEIGYKKPKSEKKSRQQFARNNEVAFTESNRVLEEIAMANAAAEENVEVIGGSADGAELANRDAKSYRPKRKGRRELQCEVNALEDLLKQLTTNNPEMQARMQQIVQSDPKYKELEMFSTGSRNNTHIKFLNTTRKDSRTATGKNKSQKYSKTQESEREVLTKYINTIVADYLGSEQRERIAELEYKGELDELDSYAERLVQAGLGRIVEAEIRINGKNNRQSFIAMSSDREALERDGIILTPVARRYAFDGDIVRAFVMNSTVLTAGNEKKKSKATTTITGGKENSFCIADDEDPFANDEDTESELETNDLDSSAVTFSDSCPSAFVLAIVKQTEAREVVGTISFKNAIKLKDENYYKLKPHDMRVPMVYIPEDKCSQHITAEVKNDICGFLYLAQVTQTDLDGHCIGELIQPVGKVGNLEAEIKAILMHNHLKDVRPYDESFNELFAAPMPPLTADDLKQREDLRSKCVFTIDPLTARDLDDAVSVESLGADQYEVGVHISDVAHYLLEDSELDNIVKQRATSIYLVNEVIHMLPKTLCFKCSLLPDEDKFTFSVFWHLNAQGEQLSKPRFTRSVIKSCTQFAYEHAQKIIDNTDENFGIDDFPTIGNGFTPADIMQRVRVLHSIAQHLRDKRYEDGAISINNPKLRFNLDPKTGEPLSYEPEARHEANFLIEEYMLLANQSVARFIYDKFPEISILRHHAPPLAKSMKALREKLANFGIEFEYGSSKQVYESMQRICREAANPKAMDACLNTLLTKPMARAKYFCSEGKTEPDDMWHYALSIPIYTHFTSPIRRYPDILVHRLLAAALNYCPAPKRSIDELHQIAKICNEQKFNAKNAGDESINLFFKRYIKSKQSIVLHAVVTEIFQHLVNVVTIETGHCIAINYKMQKVLVDTANVPAYILISERNSNSAPLKLQLFTTVDIKLVIWDERVCGFFVSPDLKQRQLNSIESSKKKLPTGAVAACVASNAAGTNNESYKAIKKQRYRNSLSATSANDNQPSSSSSSSYNKYSSKSKNKPKIRYFALKGDATALQNNSTVVKTEAKSDAAATKKDKTSKKATVVTKNDKAGA